MASAILKRHNMIAHIKLEPESIIQTTEEHRDHVADLARNFAEAFGSGSLAYLAGWLHDKGKERDSFQNYIRKENGLPTNGQSVGEHKHAFVGGLIAAQKPLHNLELANIIMGHHRGLYDDGTLKYEINNRTLPQEIKIDPLPISPSSPHIQLRKEDLHHYVRMLFSCLVDADRLDTEAFMNSDQSKLRGQGDSLPILLERLEAKLAEFKSKGNESEVNRIRNYVQQVCREKSDQPRGIFSMTVPTGGGKTLSSLLWALRHAIHNGQKRIIIAIPYTSIITQTANTLKGILGEQNVLEHHSEFDYDELKDEKLKETYQLAAENWDFPVIVTTNVQLFESMFSNKPSACRKLHNIANSVVILDEVQTLPTSYLQPIVDAISAYHRSFGVSFLFTTASQPVLSGLIEGCNPLANFHGLDSVTELIPASAKLHEKLRRVKLDIDNQPRSYDEIANAISQHDRVLCIVNTRHDAKEVYKRLPKEGLTLHLSRMMCPEHVSKTIKQITDALDDDTYKVIRVVATQLVEAGVDIDFPVVYRQEAGLDSVLQAAGRCNREGKRKLCVTYVFSLAKEHKLPPGDISNANNARLALKHDSDWFAPETMTSYFRQRYSREESFDKKKIKDYLYNYKDKMFETAAEKFRLIEDGSIPLIVVWENSLNLVAQLKEKGPSYTLMKKLSKYTVNVYESDFKALCQTGAVKELIEGIFVVDQQAQYDKELGLLIENQWEDKLLLI